MIGTQFCHAKPGPVVRSPVAGWRKVFFLIDRPFGSGLAYRNSCKPARPLDTRPFQVDAISHKIGILGMREQKQRSWRRAVPTAADDGERKQQQASLTGQFGQPWTGWEFPPVPKLSAGRPVSAGPEQIGGLLPRRSRPPTSQRTSERRRAFPSPSGSGTPGQFLQDAGRWRIALPGEWHCSFDLQNIRQTTKLNPRMDCLPLDRWDISARGNGRHSPPGWQQQPSTCVLPRRLRAAEKQYPADSAKSDSDRGLAHAPDLAWQQPLLCLPCWDSQRKVDAITDPVHCAKYVGNLHTLPVITSTLTTQNYQHLLCTLCLQSSHSTTNLKCIEELGFRWETSNAATVFQKPAR